MKHTIFPIKMSQTPIWIYLGPIQWVFHRGLLAHFLVWDTSYDLHRRDRKLFSITSTGSQCLLLVVIEQTLHDLFLFLGGMLFHVQGIQCPTIWRNDSEGYSQSFLGTSWIIGSEILNFFKSASYLLVLPWLKVFRQWLLVSLLILETCILDLCLGL